MPPSGMPISGISASGSGPNQLTVSVVIPTYNRADTVPRAVQSVLAQTWPAKEIVVVDDGSSDNTREVLSGQGPQVKYVYQDNQGVSAARNTGIRAASGDLIALLDSDDEWEPWKLELQIAAFREFPDLLIVGTDCYAIEPGGHINRNFMRQTLRAHDTFSKMKAGFRNAELGANSTSAAITVGDFSSVMFLGNLFITSSIVARRDALVQAGLFDLSLLDAGDDYDLFWRVCEAGTAGLIDAAAVRFQRSRSDHLHLSSQMPISNLRSLERYLLAHPAGPELSPGLIQRRWAQSYVWAAQTLFDDNKPKEARPFIRAAMKHGAQSSRLRAYEVLSYLPAVVTEVARRLMQTKKKVIGTKNGGTRSATARSTIPP